MNEEYRVEDFEGWDTGKWLEPEEPDYMYDEVGYNPYLGCYDWDE